MVVESGSGTAATGVTGRERHAMLYVALLSGGKDSCFNLLHCAQNGHQLLAAASLGPGPDKDEIDSYLYQTVGQDAIQLVADALEVPLMRRVIIGGPVQQGSEYGSRRGLDPHGVQGDETEDLFELLSNVKTRFPDVQGVSVGAILSNYQRVRVEHVCQRLSLTPLAYLWQRDQSELLSEMVESGMEAVLIKVAGIGLTTNHLGKTLVEMQPTLLKLNSMYGAHVCGEGGEYESLTLDSPLFKHRIILEEVETVIHSDNDFATVAFLKVKRASLQWKGSFSPSTFTVPAPFLLSNAEETICQAVSGMSPNSASGHPPVAQEVYQLWKKVASMPYTRRFGPWVVVSNVEANHTLPAQLSIEDEIQVCFKGVQDHLAKHGLDLSHIANVSIIISSMEDFSVINAAYASLFGTSPPARACVAVDLPASSRMRLECIAYAESQPHERQSLHVQSLSYWAPANIGPYSQAITVGERVFISGQIGLVPFNNTLPVPQSLPQETALSLRHVLSIADAVKHHSAASWDGVTHGVISWLAQVGDLAPVKRGMAASEHFCAGVAPTLFVVIKSLPKNALVETQVLLHTTRKVPSDEDDWELTKMVPSFSTGRLSGLEAQWEGAYFEGNEASFAIVACMCNDSEILIAKGLRAVNVLQSLWRRTLCIRLFHTHNAAPDLACLFGQLFGSDDLIPPVMAIPSRAIATWARNDWEYALCFVG